MNEPVPDFPARATMPAAAIPPRPWPPLWVFGLAILLGVLGAFYAPLGHVHFGEHGVFVHDHSHLGSHVHREGPASQPTLPTPGEHGGSVELAAALVLENFVPAVRPVVLESPEGLAALPPPGPARRLPRAPWAPRGPPVFSC